MIFTPAACASPIHIPVFDEKQTGTGIFLGKPRRHDPYESRVPMLAVSHDDALERTPFTHDRVRLGMEFFAVLLPLRVIGVELCRKSIDFLFVL